MRWVLRMAQFFLGLVPSRGTHFELPRIGWKIYSDGARVLMVWRTARARLECDPRDGQRLVRKLVLPPKTTNKDKQKDNLD
jgi:hypothetical protein